MATKIGYVCDLCGKSAASILPVRLNEKTLDICEREKCRNTRVVSLLNAIQLGKGSE